MPVRAQKKSEGHVKFLLKAAEKNFSIERRRRRTEEKKTKLDSYFKSVCDPHQWRNAVAK